jgi:hypothetical protein
VVDSQYYMRNIHIGMKEIQSAIRIYNRLPSAIQASPTPIKSPSYTTLDSYACTEKAQDLTYCIGGVVHAAGHVLLAMLIQDILDRNRKNGNCLI